jgi:hypothetical protein
MTCVSSFLTFAFCLLPFALSAQQTRDVRIGAPAEVGTATVSGTIVTDDQVPRGIRNARVEVAGEGQPARTVFSDPNGNFLFAGLAAGRYTITATKPGYVRTAFGAKRADRPGTPVTIADGQRVDGLALRLVRGSVLSGTVRDELGQPAPGIAVRVLQYRMVNGERVLSPAPTVSGPFGETTDDRGVYRVFGLAAGDYLVSATPRTVGQSDIRQMTAEEIQSAQRALQQQASPIQSAGQPATPPPIMVAYAPVFYPGTISASNAASIHLGPAEERTDVDLPLQLVRTARLEGIVVAPPGVPPQMTQLILTQGGPMVPGMPMAMSLGRVSPDSDGRFSYSGIAPGQYTISARISNRASAAGQDFTAPAEGRGRNASAPATLWAEAEVTVNGENISGISLSLQPGLTVSGRVVLEPSSDTGAPIDLSRVRLSLTPAATGTIMIAIGGTGTQADTDGRFNLSDITPGKYRFAVQPAGLESTWSLKSALVDGRDTLDFPLEIGPNDKVSDAVLTLTNRTQEVNGTLQDAAGRPAPDFTVVVFPADKALWSVPRRIRTARPGTDGRFIVRGLPEGSYRIAALVDIAPGEANDPGLLEQLVPASVPFSLGSGEHKVQDIRIAG